MQLTDAEVEANYVDVSGNDCGKFIDMDTERLYLIFRSRMHLLGDRMIEIHLISRTAIIAALALVAAQDQWNRSVRLSMSSVTIPAVAITSYQLYGSGGTR